MIASASQSENLQDPATLAALSRRALMLALLMLPALALTIYLVISQSRATRFGDLARRAIPAIIVSNNGANGATGSIWTSTESTFSDAEMELLETHDYVYRTYTDGHGSPVDLCVIFSEDNRKGTHPPDVCVEASGLRIVSRNDRAVTPASGPGLTLRELLTTDGNGQYIYFAYFYKCGDTLTPSFYQQQVQIIWNGLTRQNASGALIRFSTPMANAGDLAAGRARVDELLAATLPHIRASLDETR